MTIQAMFPAEVSGVVFSKLPGVNEDCVTIEAVAGVGTPLVGGDVTPARWLISRQTLERLEEPERHVLDGTPLRDFSRNGLNRLCGDVERIEVLFDGSVDVEFGYAGGELVYFQGRPAVLPRAVRSAEHVREAERQRLREFSCEGRCWWVLHNLSESLPAPTPLTWDLWQEFMTGGGGFGRMYRRLGYKPAHAVVRETVLELIGGRIYADADRLPQMLCAGYPLSFDPQVVRSDPRAIDRAPTKLDLERLDPWFLLRWPAVAWTMFRAGRHRVRLTRDAAARFDGEIVPLIRERVALERSVNLIELSPSELTGLFERRRKWIFDEVAPETIMPGTLGTLAWSRLELRIHEIFGPADGVALANRLLSEINAPLTGRQFQLYAQLTNGAATLDDVLDQIGHRGPGEMDLAVPRWREHPEALQRTVSQWCAASASEDQSTQAIVPNDLLSNALRDAGAASLHRDLEPLLHAAVRLLPYRETGKDEFLRAYELLRDVLCELSRRSGLGDRIHYLTTGELQQLPSNREMRPVAEERREARRIALTWEFPAVLELQSDPGVFEEQAASSRGPDAIDGTPLSGGQANGPACRLLDVGPFCEPAAGSVIVASTLDAGALPFLADVAAIVVEQGGMLSHLALLARQLGIPAVAAAGITKCIADGEALQVDGDRGTIDFPERRE